MNCYWCGETIPEESDSSFCDEVCEDFYENRRREKQDIDHDALERADMESHR